MTTVGGWEGAALELLCELAAGVMAHRLYGSEHPRAERAGDRVFDRFEELFLRLAAADEHSGRAPSLELTVLQNELFFHGSPFTRAAESIGVLVREFHHHGVDRVVFAPGLGRSELAALIEDLGRLEPTPVASFGHIRVSRVASVGGVQEEGAAGPARLLEVHERVGVLSRAADAVARDRPLPWSDIHGVVGQLDLRIQRAGDPLALLAPLGDEIDWLAVHAHNTATVSLALAVAAGLETGSRHELGVAAALHDLGKFAIPPERVRQEFDLTGTEWELSFNHPQRGLEILLAAPEAPELARVVVFDHHLRGDGQGFPTLPDTRSPHPAAALVAVAEAFDIMHTVRWTRGSIGPEEIGELLLAASGTALDPVFARMMLSIWEASEASF